MAITFKNYHCKACGYAKKIDTNHFGECYSFGKYNRCPKCRPLPPDPKHPQFVNYPTTTWVCDEVVPKDGWVPKPWNEITAEELEEAIAATDGKPLTGSFNPDTGEHFA